MGNTSHCSAPKDVSWHQTGTKPGLHQVATWCGAMLDALIDAKEHVWRPSKCVRLA